MPNPDTETWTWLVARDYAETRVVCTTFAHGKTIEAFLNNLGPNSITETIKRPAGRYWDGTRVTDAECRRYGLPLTGR